MNLPLVSVLMTSYNREKYIAQAMESVLASTYRNLELIVVDDRSTDGTVAIARDLAARDSRVRVYINEKNLGDYPNRNQAASHAAGVYLKYVDADDYIYPWGLELLVRMMENFPQAGWGLCSLDQYDPQPFPVMLNPREAYEYNYTRASLFHKAPLSSIIRRNVFEEAGGFTPQRMSGDYEMWHRLALKYPVLLMPHGIVWYRKHGEQEIKSYSQYIESYEKITLHYLTLPDCPLGKELVEGIIRKKRRAQNLALLKAAVRLKAAEVRNIWKRLKLYHVI